ncbi:hypothetical protein E2C01_080470 [Portunus trituberculatus]|uniref:Uncharacterized protein n=1 Tax=Portunus trituberculatus TaxID=210409 RepID=A0A5B7IVH9_PORTR|nr:hypothetical protein [Portunus trituberculatus]
MLCPGGSGRPVFPSEAPDALQGDGCPSLQNIHEDLAPLPLL